MYQIPNDPCSDISSNFSPPPTTHGSYLLVTIMYFLTFFEIFWDSLGLFVILWDYKRLCGLCLTLLNFDILQIFF